MPVDLSGITPGTKKVENLPKKIHVRCKNPGCDSILAIEVEIPGQKGGGFRLYQCCKCKQSWNVTVGGYVNL